MIYFDKVICCIIILLFPILVYFCYVGYNSENTEMEDDLMFSLAIYTASYMILTRANMLFPKIALLFINVPILIFYLKNKEKDGLLLSVIHILICFFKFEIPIFFIILEYFSLFLLYLVKKRYYVSDINFILQFYTIKLIIYWLKIDVAKHYFNNSHLVLTLPFVILSSILILHIVKLGDKIVKYHISYKQLLKEKNLRQSLNKISHEIKNPLSVCKGYLSIMKPDNEKNAEYIEIIKEEIDDAISIIQDFSNFNKLKMEKDYFNLSKTVEKVSSNYETIMKTNKIELVTNIEPNINYYGDENRIKQVLINVIKNSIEALEEKEEENKMIRIILENKKDIIIKVIDNGIGCSEEEIKRIGEPFFTTKHKGTGLGVALSKEIIESHNGKMSYEGSINKGCIVTIKLKKK